MEDLESLRMRVHGDPRATPLIYLPGLHGDWTLVGGFRNAIRNHVRFVEFTYPRTLTWSLDDYAEAIENKLIDAGITSGWLLGESFGSQILWPMLRRQRLPFTAAVLAGGFVRHPVVWLVELGAVAGRGVPLRLITSILFGYARIARFRYRKDPAVLGAIDEFVSRRTELDKQAAVHRLRLIAASDPRQSASEVKAPLYAITGVLDPVVPWVAVRRWLRGNCSALRDYRVVLGADHNVLGTAPAAAASQIVKWMRSH